MESPTARTFTSGAFDRLAGVSINTDPAICSVGFKPPATISQEQETARYDGSKGTLATRGRHDPCVLPRAVPIVETMAAIVIMEYVLTSALDECSLLNITFAALFCNKTPEWLRLLSWRHSHICHRQ